MSTVHKYPRLYVDQPLATGQPAAFTQAQAHYLKNVLRRERGDNVRLFNPRDGEWLAEISALDKKSGAAHCIEQRRPPAPITRRLHLFFAPLAKDRLDFLIEKAVELGATDLHPALFRQSDIRKINAGRLEAQIIEAAEQCERLDIPTLHEMTDGDSLGQNWNPATPIFTALERSDAPPLTAYSKDCALLVGPPGGFTEEEKHRMSAAPFITPVSLGPAILRTETAALYGLSILRGPVIL